MDYAQLIGTVYDASLTNVGMSLALAAALAWNEVVKYLLKQNVTLTQRDGVRYYVTYALIVTGLTAVFYLAAKKILRKDVPRRDVAYPAGF